MALAEKDVTQKTLESHNDVFADIVNVLLFGGENLVNEDDLIPDITGSAYKAEGKIHSQERDVSKFWQNSNIHISLFGMENQTKIEKNMPMRVIGYDGASYRNQLTRKNRNEQQLNYPVVTMILYFGMERWNKNLSLKDCLDIPEKLKPFVSDYNINVFEVAYLSDEQVSKFKSDFKIIADYFVQIRKTKKYVPMTDNIKHVWETLNLMSVLTEDDKFEKSFRQVNRKERVNMCEVVDSFIKQGREEGKREERIQLILNMYEDGMTVSKIANIVRTTEETIVTILKSAGK
jgi:hypothetical protein